jgi:predicted dinucleotide-binding enzyme
MKKRHAYYSPVTLFVHIGMIGAGHIGSALAVRLSRLGHSVAIANSGGPETLTDLAQKTGAMPAAAKEAARNADLIVVTIPLKNSPDLPRDLFEGVPAGGPVIDASSYYPLLRNGQLPELETGDLTESEWGQQHLGRPVLKVFKTSSPLTSKTTARKHFADLGTTRPPEQHAQCLANQAASEKQLRAQSVKLHGLSPHFQLSHPAANRLQLSLTK